MISGIAVNTIIQHRKLRLPRPRQVQPKQRIKLQKKSKYDQQSSKLFIYMIVF